MSTTRSAMASLSAANHNEYGYLQHKDLVLSQCVVGLTSAIVIAFAANAILSGREYLARPSVDHGVFFLAAFALIWERSTNYGAKSRTILERELRADPYQCERYQLQIFDSLAAVKQRHGAIVSCAVVYSIWSIFESASSNYPVTKMLCSLTATASLAVAAYRIMQNGPKVEEVQVEAETPSLR